MRGYERMVALRYLRPRREDGFISLIALISLIGIAIGVATLISVLSVMNGYRHELLGLVLGLNGHIVVSDASGSVEGYDALAQRLRRIPGVAQAAPQIERQAMLTANGATSGAVVRAMDPALLAQRAILADNVLFGSVADLGENGALIGIRLAQRLGLTVGDDISLVTPKGRSTAFGTVPRVRAFPVRAIYETGMYEYDNAFVFLPLEAAQRFFEMPGRTTGVEVMVTDPDRVDDVAATIATSLGSAYRVLDWKRRSGAFFNAVQVERNVMAFILTMIIIVAAFNLLSSLIMLVKEKRRDIAILRTMGATSASVMRIFVLAGTIVGFVGTLAGVGLGLLLAFNIERLRQALQSVFGTDLFAAEIYFLTRLPAVVDPVEVVVVVGIALVMSFLATLYPSWRASRVHPAVALRDE